MINRYYLAWVKAYGPCRKWYNFTAWIRNKHQEFRIINKLPLHVVFYKTELQKAFELFVNIGPHEKL